MAGRIVAPYERALSTTVNDIEHIESQSFPGIGVVKIYFQPTVEHQRRAGAGHVDFANHPEAASRRASRRRSSWSTTPRAFRSSSWRLSSDTLSQVELFDLAQNFIRPQLTTVAGAQLPYAYGGATRQVQIDLDQNALHAHNLSATDVGNALARQNLITPVGTEKIGTYEFTVDLNDSPKAIADFNNLPIKVVNGAVVFMRDVAYVHDGSPPQTNVVQLDGRKGVLMSVLKIGSASTLDIIAGIKARLPGDPGDAAARRQRSSSSRDQSGFVKSSVAAVVREGLIAAALTGFMILVFLGSWRSTLIITVSIPLAVSELADRAFRARPDDQRHDARRPCARGRHSRRRRDGDDREHQSPHGGAWRGHPDRHHPRRAGNHAAGDGRAVLHLHRLRAAARARRRRRLSVPAARDGGRLRDDRVLHSDLHARADDGAFPARATSIVITRPAARSASRRRAGLFGRFQRGFEHHFERFRARLSRLAATGAAAPLRGSPAASFASSLLSLGLAPFLGQDFFPSVDAGAIKIHMRAPTGTRIEETTRLADQVEQKIRAIIPPDRLASIVDNIGLPISGINHFLRELRHDRRLRRRHARHA